MQVTVFYEYWQMDCCGDPFVVGDGIDWVCVQGNHGGLVAYDYYYEAHGDGETQAFQITGQVIDIAKIEFQYKSKNGIYVPISYHKSSIKKAQAFMFENGGGFLVLLDNVVIKS